MFWQVKNLQNFLANCLEVTRTKAFLASEFNWGSWVLESEETEHLAMQCLNLEKWPLRLNPKLYLSHVLRQVWKVGLNRHRLTMPQIAWIVYGELRATVGGAADHCWPGTRSSIHEMEDPQPHNHTMFLSRANSFQCCCHYLQSIPWVHALNISE